MLRSRSPSKQFSQCGSSCRTWALDELPERVGRCCGSGSRGKVANLFEGQLRLRNGWRFGIGLHVRFKLGDGIRVLAQADQRISAHEMNGRKLRREGLCLAQLIEGPLIIGLCGKRFAHLEVALPRGRLQPETLLQAADSIIEL